MALYYSVPFRGFSGNTYPYTHPASASDPTLAWWDGTGGYFGDEGGPTDFSSVSGTNDSYTVSWAVSGHHWTHRYLSDGAYDGGGCAHVIFRSGHAQFNSGWVFNGSNMKSWATGDVVYVRFRIRYDDVWRWDGESTMQNKMVDWGAESGGGNRVIFMNEMPHTGDVCTIPSATYGTSTYGGFSLKQGIGGSIGDNFCTPGLVVTYGTWYHIQLAVQTSASGTGFHKVWINNNSAGSPSASWLNQNIGVSSWNDSWEFGGFMSETCSRDQGFRYSHLEVGDSFDANWYPDAPASPGRLLFVR